MKQYGFKSFLLNESSQYLGQKVGDILSATQELRDDAKNMGTRDLVRFSERIVNQIRRVLHSNWPKEEKKRLLSLQKVGVALMKAIEEKDDLPGTIAGSVAILEKLVGNMGIPINKLASTDSEPNPEDDLGTDKPTNQSTPPPKPTTIAQDGPNGPPTPPGQDLYARPLGGSSGPLDSM